MKILCAGDLHLGRRSSRLPDDAGPRAHSATAAWNALVDLALAERVQLVALSGDLVDRANRYFEAFGPLERGVARLAAAGIHVIAVAGNHDFDVLPRLVPSLGKTFHLLGPGGTWTGLNVPGPGGGARLRVVGWSFPAEHVTTSPVAGFPALPGDDVPVLGLVHGDLDAPASRYAPLSAAELRARPVSFWLLGHIHASRLDEQPGAAPLLYPGSPQALDPGETGAHGAWLLELAAGRIPRVRPVPLSSVRYDTVEADVTGAAGTEEAERRVAEAVHAHLQSVVEGGCGPLRHLICRVRVSGRTALHRSIEPHLRAHAGDLQAEHGEVRARVEQVVSETRPLADLHALAATADAPGVLAKFVLAMDSGRLDPGEERLLAELAGRAAEVRRARAYQPLADATVPADALRELARRQALLLLDELLAQKEAA
jgi:DNA repair exonuclease SbcCD nuclease subunit